MIQIEDLKFEEFIPEKDILKRVKEISEKINLDFVEKKPLFLGILNGSFLFAADLFKHISVPCEISFLKVNSYVNTESTGKMKELIGINQPLSDRHVIVIEDIVDTGRTLQFILDTVKSQNPASISVITLLHKPEATLIPLKLNYVGFEIENQFVVGYGLDYNGYGRNLPAIYIKTED
ncbi:MAG: hypoxanthine phosphoribosyltransferase [Cytophagaceae bacterium]|nr:hypoxanthine phosphoribosyltransferase [Cytophagaceae bacterium]MBK9510296.1 hypoxanthine phosphoribosyltransferase [Cytophagaceae bacterium]